MPERIFCALDSNESEVLELVATELETMFDVEVVVVVVVVVVDDDDV